jgi:hypothetical protein
MNMYEKGTQVHATTVFFVKDGALYVDEAKTVAAKKEDAAKAILSGRVLINDGTDFKTVTSVAIDGTSVVVGSDSYTLS